MTTVMTKRRFSVNEFYKMAKAGILCEDDRVELVDGEIVDMAGIGSYHASCVDALTYMFVRRAPEGIIVRVQNPVHLNEFNEFQPDLAILLPRDDFYKESHPTPKDVLLIIEVSDSSVDYDRNVKLPRYAREAIPELWQVNLVYEHIDAFTDVDPLAGTYRTRRRYLRGDSVTPTLLSEITLEVGEILR